MVNKLRKKYVQVVWPCTCNVLGAADPVMYVSSMYVSVSYL